MLALYILVLILCIEATTNILSKSLLFKPLRAYLFNHSNNRCFKFLHNMLDCPYCTSVWVGFFYSIMFYLFINNVLPLFFIWLFVAIAAHRTSNILHFVIDRIDVNHIVFPE